MMVGRRSFPFGMVCFQWRTVKLPGGILFSSLHQFLHHVNTNSPLEVFTFASWTAMCAPGSWRPPNMTRARQPTWQMMKGEDDFWWICGSFQMDPRKNWGWFLVVWGCSFEWICGKDCWNVKLTPCFKIFLRALTYVIFRRELVSRKFVTQIGSIKNHSFWSLFLAKTNFWVKDHSCVGKGPRLFTVCVENGFSDVFSPSQKRRKLADRKGCGSACFLPKTYIKNGCFKPVKCAGKKV